jgi:membrane protein DedA with SNARE-associated domain
VCRISGRVSAVTPCQYKLESRPPKPSRRGQLLVEGIIEHFTYLGIFLVLFGAGLGIPIPEEIPVLAAGALAQEGVIRWWIGLPVCLVGVLAGDTVLYWVGRHWGEHILDWRVVRHVLTPEREERLKAAYHRHGVKIVVIARHIAGLRAAAFLTAGIVRLPFPRFIAVDGGAALVGVPLSFGLAFVFTDQIERLVSDLHRIERWAMLLGLLALAAWLAVLAYRRARREAKAERLE